ncbi:STAS domain-containing protein [Pseudobacteroides cellulosolvens]|uniref:Sulfate transporter/antisigma-factor antagonist STAS n=1 Tax=Pseudobacteroides cellulosolvens ATCC 35603 = DSM 2933 TaxID=398512 RepID=A0A0L6JSY7_9FIRM|nr:STAS domain-containing protein [Pseudobacteroides cellulosolvens]KNY28805.1 Sulfate transporter/antisigma-factor antagonist STAS [Pseudobacteroides cellulosolvens ATCC 35603 = DSM 2933]
MDRTNSSDIILITNTVHGNNLTICFSGYLVYQNSGLAKEKLNENYKDSDGYILDFSKVTRIDSTGFGLILNFMSKKPKNSPVVAVVCDEFIMELFKITKIDRLVPLCSSIDEALKLISK